MKMPDYHSFLLRLWREGPRGPWRASLEDPNTGSRRAFADAGALLAFIAAQMDAAPLPATGPPAARDEHDGAPPPPRCNPDAPP